jgi:hypothetical protein
LASLACGQRNPENLLVDHASGQIGVSLRCGDRRLSTGNFDALTQAERQRAHAEDLRLLYVAATRAKDCLVVPQVRPKDGRPSRFLEFLDHGPLQEAVPSKSTCRDGILLIRAEDLPAPAVPAAVLRCDVGARAPAAELTSPILAERQAWMECRTNLGLRPGAVDQLREGGESAAGQPSVTAAALGAAFHSIMQQVSLTEAGGPDALIAHAAESRQLGSYAAVLRDWVKHALASPLWQRARRAALAMAPLRKATSICCLRRVKVWC